MITEGGWHHTRFVTALRWVVPLALCCFIHCRILSFKAMAHGHRSFWYQNPTISTNKQKIQKPPDIPNDCFRLQVCAENASFQIIIQALRPHILIKKKKKKKTKQTNKQKARRFPRLFILCWLSTQERASITCDEKHCDLFLFSGSTRDRVLATPNGKKKWREDLLKKKKNVNERPRQKLGRYSWQQANTHGYILMYFKL